MSLPLLSLPAHAERERWKMIADDWHQQWEVAEREWSAALRANQPGEAPGDLALLVAAAEKIRPLVKIREAEGPPWENQQASDRYLRMDWQLAVAATAAGDHAKALEYLTQQAATPVSLFEGSRNPDSFAPDVLALHAEIMARTGKVADIQHSGYQVFGVVSPGAPPRFVFVREPFEKEISQITIEGVEDDEQKHEVSLYEATAERDVRYLGSSFVYTGRGKLTVSVADRTGPVLTLRGVTKIVEFRGELHVPHLHVSPRSEIELRMNGEKIEQPLDAIRRMDQAGEK
ncbi:hypothetical protein OKA04_11965 [Luteolibacter flavescens]|uniref:Uncharacterized protein n=1 Tax=Luteolibacter flavescens TaxID=1859460 RepID=A0ABT3FPE0_9BACT|nr:hypothetical protein [Luteolibacter flavescens]